MMPRLVAGLYAAIFASLNLSANSDTNSVHYLPKVVVYASRLDENINDMPATIFTPKSIAQSGARDLPQLLNKSSGVDIHSMGGNPLLTSIAIRGFGDNAFSRIKFIFDGEHLNNVDMSTPNLTRIPLAGVERVEFLRGPNPVLYGDGAVAGVVKVKSDSDDYDELTKITASAGSYNTYGVNLLTKGGIEEEGVLYGVSYDYQRSSGYRERSAYGIHTLNSNVRKNFENDSTFSLKVNYQNASYELPGALTYDEWQETPNKAKYLADAARLWSLGLSFDSKIKVSEDSELRIDGSLAHNFRHVLYNSSNSDLEYDIDSFHLSPRYFLEKNLLGLKNEFTTGLEFRYDRYSENHPMSYGTKVKRCFTRDRSAFFAFNEIECSESLSLNAGVRAERIYNKCARYSNLSQFDSIDWQGDYELALVYRLANWAKTYLKTTRFHRSAFSDELSYTEDGKFLKPENGYSLDIGAEFVFLEEFTFDINGYGTLMEDEIFYDSAIKPFGYNVNSPAKTRRAGFDVAISWCREKVAEVNLRYGAVYADFASGMYKNNKIPFVPSHRGRVEAGVWISNDVEIKAGVSFVDSQYLSGDFANSAKELDSYLLTDISVYYEPSWAKKYRFKAVIDNLFDTNYCDYAGIGYYYPALGRSVVFTLSREF
ncbi:MAG: TonB-dependent receptor plug domain-containing protein [Kiritimatiellae bacterium]|nr:TonB-dependent receptor plug domain-containing protein [Kiritimatiellia bacterium]